VGSGEIVAILGSNGAGKSTLLKTVVGLLKPAAGDVVVAGKNMAGRRPEQIAAAGVVLVPEGRQLFAGMTVLDNLTLGAYTQRRRGTPLRGRLDAVYARFPRLAERVAQRADTLSGGERQMLAIGRALMCSPRLLMLDEPSLGLAPLVVQEIFAIVRRLRDDGVAILLVEQNARAALESSDHGYVLETGEVRLSGASSQLAADPRVQATYLGGTTDDD